MVDNERSIIDKKKPFENKINKEREDERKIKVEVTMNEPIQSYLGWVG